MLVAEKSVIISERNVSFLRWLFILKMPSDTLAVYMYRFDGTKVCKFIAIMVETFLFCYQVKGLKSVGKGNILRLTDNLVMPLNILCYQTFNYITSSFRFYLASDTTGELWLSSDESESNLVKIVTLNGWTDHNQWLKLVIFFFV